MASVKCHESDDRNSVDLETWTGRNETPECSIPANRDLKHVVKVVNWRRKTIEVEIESEALNGRVIFESGKSSSWNGRIVISGRKRGSGENGYGRDYVLADQSQVGNTETIKTSIVYWNKYNKRRNEEDKELHFEIDLV